MWAKIASYVKAPMGAYLGHYGNIKGEQGYTTFFRHDAKFDLGLDPAGVVCIFYYTNHLVAFAD